jgi:hypothetical protein
MAHYLIDMLINMKVKYTIFGTLSRGAHSEELWPDLAGFGNLSGLRSVDRREITSFPLPIHIFI